MDYDAWIGDDLLLLEYLENPSLGYSKNISSILTWAQGGIWRPIWQVLNYTLFKIFGDNRNEWLGFSIILILLSLFVVTLILREFNFKITNGILVIILVSTSPYLWFQFNSIFGIMEGMALLFGLLTVYCLLREKRFYLYLSILFFTISTLSHERYIFLLIPILYAISYQNKNALVKRKLKIYLLLFGIVFSNVAIRYFLSKTFIRTGGESGGITIETLKLLPLRLIIGIFGMTGVNLGNYNEQISIIQFDITKIIPYFGWHSWIIIIILVLIISRYYFNSFKKYINVKNKILTLAILSLIFPATLVIERIENRWLVFSYTLTIVLILLKLKEGEIPKIYYLVCISFIIFTFANSLLSLRYYNTNKNFHFAANKNTSQMVKVINEIDGPVQVEIRTGFPYLEWLFGYDYFYKRTLEHQKLKNLFYIKYNFDEAESKNLKNEKSSTKIDNFEDFIATDKQIEGILLKDFDSKFYSNKYPDVILKGIDPKKHYLDIGFKEGRLKNQFDTQNNNYEQVKQYLSINMKCVNIDFLKSNQRYLNINYEKCNTIDVTNKFFGIYK